MKQWGVQIRKEDFAFFPKISFFNILNLCNMTFISPTYELSMLISTASKWGKKFCKRTILHFLDVKQHIKRRFCLKGKLKKQGIKRRFCLLYLAKSSFMCFTSRKCENSLSCKVRKRALSAFLKSTAQLEYPASFALFNNHYTYL